MAVSASSLYVPHVLPKGSGLRYQKDEGTWSVYVMEIDARPVFEVSIDNEDPELAIYVGKVGARWAEIEDVGDMIKQLGPSLKTNGRAKRNTHEVGGSAESPGDLVIHIDGMSVQTYVYSRAARIMADLYVPKIGVPKSAESTDPPVDPGPLGSSEI